MIEHMKISNCKETQSAKRYYFIVNIPGFPNEAARPPSYSELLREIALKNKQPGPYYNLKYDNDRNQSLNRKTSNGSLTFEELKFTSKAKDVKIRVYSRFAVILEFLKEGDCKKLKKKLCD